MLAYVVCLTCGSSFAIPREFLPSTRFPCVECHVGVYTQLKAS